MTPLSERPQRVPAAVLAAAFLFNLGQGVLRPAMPLYLQRTFSANYRMVTLIPVVFGAGKWIANLPTGYLLNRLGRPLMVGGLGHVRDRCHDRHRQRGGAATQKPGGQLASDERDIGTVARQRRRRLAL
jgi:hypothetical protein